MRYGYERITEPLNNFTWLYKYKGNYYPRTKIVKVAADWTQIVRQTKYKLLDTPDRWEELEDYGIEVILAAKIGINHYITTEGILLSLSFKEVCKNNKSYVEFIEEGVSYRIFRASLVIAAFLEPEFDFDNDKPYYMDGNMLNTDISNVVKLDSSKSWRTKK